MKLHTKALAALLAGMLVFGTAACGGGGGTGGATEYES